MTTLELLQKEFRDELILTKRVLDRVPEDKLTWKPHHRSMTLGQLALHIALVPGDIAAITQPDIFDVSTNTFVNPQPHALAEIHFALNQSADAVEQALAHSTDAHAQAPLAPHVRRQRTQRRAPHHRLALPHVQPVDPPSRPALRLPPPPRPLRPRHLRPQCRRAPSLITRTLTSPAR